jgi:hypothetical protein
MLVHFYSLATSIVTNDKKKSSEEQQSWRKRQTHVNPENVQKSRAKIPQQNAKLNLYKI